MPENFDTGSSFWLNAIVENARTIAHCHNAVVIGDRLVVHKIVMVNTGMHSLKNKTSLPPIKLRVRNFRRRGAPQIDSVEITAMTVNDKRAFYVEPAMGNNGLRSIYRDRVNARGFYFHIIKHQFNKIGRLLNAPGDV